MSDPKTDELLRRVKMAHEKTTEAIAALEAHVNQEPSEGQLARIAVEGFCSLWKEVYKSDYVVGNWRSAIVNMKRLIIAHGTVDTRQRVRAYLASSDPFYKQAKHPLEMFFTAANRFAVAAPDKFDDILAAPPADCHHKPRCHTDLQCTRRGR